MGAASLWKEVISLWLISQLENTGNSSPGWLLWFREAGGVWSVCQHWNFHPFSTSSAVEKLPDTGLPEQCHAPHRSPNSSEEPKCSLGWLQRAQMPSAVQPEGGLSPAWGVLSLLLHHQCLKAPCFLWEQLCCKRRNLCRVIMFLFS